MNVIIAALGGGVKKVGGAGNSGETEERERNGRCTREGRGGGWGERRESGGGVDVMDWRMVGVACVGI